MPPRTVPTDDEDETFSASDTWENWARQRVRELYAEADRLTASAKELNAAIQQHETIRRLGRLP